MGSEKTFHEEMVESLGGSTQTHTKGKFEYDQPSKSEELIFIFAKLLYIFLFSLFIFYSLSFVSVIFTGGGYTELRSRVLSMAFFVFAIAAISTAIRGYIGGYSYMFEALRITFTSKKHDPNKINKLRDLVFGIKYDTLAFYGSLMVFAFTFFVMPY